MLQEKQTSLVLHILFQVIPATQEQRAVGLHQPLMIGQEEQDQEELLETMEPAILLLQLLGLEKMALLVQQDLKDSVLQEDQQEITAVPDIQTV
jgi:hypothetical protein